MLLAPASGTHVPLASSVSAAESKELTNLSLRDLAYPYLVCNPRRILKSFHISLDHGQAGLYCHGAEE